MRSHLAAILHRPLTGFHPSHNRARRCSRARECCPSLPARSHCRLHADEPPPHGQLQRHHKQHISLITLLRPPELFVSSIRSGRPQSSSPPPLLLPLLLPASAVRPTRVAPGSGAAGAARRRSRSRALRCRFVDGVACGREVEARSCTRATLHATTALSIDVFCASRDGGDCSPTGGVNQLMTAPACSTVGDIVRNNMHCKTWLRCARRRPFARQQHRRPWCWRRARRSALPRLHPRRSRCAAASAAPCAPCWTARA